MKESLLKEVYPGIFRITERGVLGMLKPPVNIYVITGNNGLLYDAGYGNGSSIREFSKIYKEINRICRERGVENNINRILLSHAHADHFAGLNKLRKRFGFKVILTFEMAEIINSGKSYRDSYSLEENIKRNISNVLTDILKFINRKIEFRIYKLYWGISFVKKPDILIKSESKININDEDWHIFRSPGHSTEHIILHNREKGILFSGDNVLNSINVWLGPPKSDLDEYEDSLKKISSLSGLKIILPAHGSPVVEPYKRLNEIIEWRKKRTEDVFNILQKSFPEGVTVHEILETLYPSDGKMKKEFAGGWVELTLKKLVSKLNGYFFLKIFLYRVIGSIVMLKEEIAESNYHMQMYYKALGVFLLPVVTIHAVGNEIRYITVWIMVITIVLFYLASLVRSIYIGNRKGISIFYLILYLCMLEILPLILIFKILTKE